MTLDPTVPPAPPSPSRRKSDCVSPGAQVGRYRVEHLAGRGGMGEVFKAWDTLLERHVALKAIPGDVVEDEDARVRFHQEAMALAQLNHPHILQVFDVVEAGGRTFLALEWVEGVPLDAGGEAMPLRAILHLWLQTAQALEAAHAKGLVHRDLKPGNLMLDGEGRLKVLDFGLAHRAGARPVLTPRSSQGTGSELGRPLSEVMGSELATGLYAVSTPTVTHESLDRATVQGSFAGSPRYASPEQIRGEAVASASDIWSLGVTLWELVFRSSPYPDLGLAHTKAVLEGRRESMPSHPLPRPLRHLLEQMLDPVAERRPSAQALANRLQAYLHPSKTGRWLLAIAGSVLVTAVLGYGLFLRGVAGDLVRHRPARVAVFPFENATGRGDLDASCRWMLPDLLVRDLSTRKLVGIDGEDLQRAVQRLRIQDFSGAQTDQAMRVAAAVGASLMVTGRLEPGQGGLRLVLELKDAQGRMRHRQVLNVPKGSQGTIPRLAFDAARSLAKAVDPMGRFPDLPPDALDEASLERLAQGHAAFAKGDFKTAEPHFREVAYRHPRYGPAVLFYGRCLARLGTQPAEPIFLWARMSAQAQGMRADELRALSAYALRLTDRGEREAALEAHQQALQLAEALGDPDHLGSVLSAMGMLLHQQHRLTEAKAQFERALACFQQSQNRHAMSRLLNNLAVMDKGEGRLEEADRRYQQALSTCREMKDRWGEAVALNNLGDLALIRGRLPEARKQFHQALELRRAVGDAGGEAYSLVGLGSVAQAEGNLSEARRFQEEALAQARRQGLRPMEGLALYNLGEVTRAAGIWAEARGFYREAQRLHRDLKDDAMEAHALAGEAECLARERPSGLTEAQALFRQAKVRHPDDSPYLLRTQGWLARTAGDLDGASRFFTRALAEARKQAPELVRELAAPAW